MTRIPTASSTESTFIRTDINYTQDGKQISYLHLPHSPHEDAWGVMPIPIAVIKNGEGPTVLLMGGNHGDEYEGPLVLNEIIRTIEPDKVQGRLIILPAVNQPAALGGRRVSPVDGLNMNRTFPGDSAGTMTQQISHYVATVLMPMADMFVDLHSGGSSLDFIPSAIIELSDDADIARRNIEAVRAFGAPMTLIMDNLGESRTSTATARMLGKIVIGAEMGGSGVVSPQGIKVARNGVNNLLNLWGVFSNGPASSAYDGDFFEAEDESSYVYAPAVGVFEPFHELGAHVTEGEPAGQVHFLDDPARKPVVARFRREGVLFCRRAIGQVKRGNCVAVIVSKSKKVD